MRGMSDTTSPEPTACQAECEQVQGLTPSLPSALDGGLAFVAMRDSGSVLLPIEFHDVVVDPIVNRPVLSLHGVKLP